MLGFKSTGTKEFDLSSHVEIDTRRLRLSTAYWESEERRKEEGNPCRILLVSIVDSPIVEACISCCVLSDLVLTIVSFTVSPEASDSDILFWVTAFLLTVMLMDVILRVLKEGRRFFKRPLNWLEFLVAVGGAALVALDGFTRACGKGCSNNGFANDRSGASLGRTIRPILRGLRIVRALTQAFSSRGGIYAQLDRQADKLTSCIIRQSLRDILLMPRDNLEVNPTRGKLHLEKVQVKTSAFEGLHLPFTIDSGICDLCHVEINFNPKPKAHGPTLDDPHRSIVVIENLIIVFSPGDYQDPPDNVWDFDGVAERKTKLVDLMIRRLEANAKPRQAKKGEFGGVGEGSQCSIGSTTTSKSTKSRRSGKAQNFVKRRVRRLVEGVLAHGMHVSIRNLELRYEDHAGKLTGDGNGLVSGMRVGSAQLHVQGSALAESFEESRQDGFRPQGKWHVPGKEKDVDKGCPKSESSNITGDRTSGPRNIIGIRPLKQKRTINNGIRAGLQVDRFCVFWDLVPAGKLAREHGYSVQLQEGSVIDITRFLEGNKSKCRRERAALALCSEVERRLVPNLGRNARERIRRLRERVSLHQYLLMPCDVSAHAILRPMNGVVNFDVAESSSWATSPMSNLSTILPPLQNDVDVKVASVNVLADLSQLASIVHLLDGFKRWKEDDRRFQWRPPPASRGASSAQAKWAFALERVLHGIDPRCPWKSLFFLEMRRLRSYRQELFSILCMCPPIDMARAVVLEVSMPLKDILFARKEAAVVRASRRQREKEAKALSRACVLFKRAIKMPCSSSKRSSSTVAVELESVQAELSDYSRGSSAASLQSQRTGSTTRLTTDVAGSGEKEFNFQVRVFVGLITSCLLRSSSNRRMERNRRDVLSDGRRRPIFKVEVESIVVAAAKAAPWEVWSRMAPQSTLVAQASEQHVLRSKTTEWMDERSFIAVPLRGIVVDASIWRMHSVFCMAPSSAPILRRMVACSSELWIGKQLKDPPNNESLKGVHAVPQQGRTDAVPNKADVAFRLRIAFVYALNNSCDHLDVAVCMFPIQINIFKPIIDEIRKFLRPHLGIPLPWLQRQYGVGLDAAILAQMVAARRARDGWIKKLKATKRVEKALGITKPLREQSVSANVLLLGGLRAQIIEPASRLRWLSRSVELPRGTLEIQRSADCYLGAKVAFKPSHNVPTQGDDTGWWFESKDEYEFIRQVSLTGVLPYDASCAGVEAYELPVEEVLSAHLSLYGYARTKDEAVMQGTFPLNRIRHLGMYLPRVSAKGVTVDKFPLLVRLEPARLKVPLCGAVTLPGLCCRGLEWAPGVQPTAPSSWRLLALASPLPAGLAPSRLLLPATFEPSAVKVAPSQKVTSHFGADVKSHNKVSAPTKQELLHDTQKDSYHDTADSSALAGIFVSVESLHPEVLGLPPPSLLLRNGAFVFAG